MEENRLDDNLFPRENKFERNSLGVQLLILFALTLGFFIASQILAAIIMFAFYDMDVLDLHKVVDAHKSLNPLRVAQMLATVLGFGAPALIFSKLKTGSFTKFSTIENKFPALLLVIVPFLVITAYPLINVSYFINQHSIISDWLKSTQEQYAFLTTALMSGTTVSLLIINLFTIAIFPAIAEEWLFRGTLQPLLQKQINVHAAILITAFTFSLIHVEFSAFLPRICLGILLGYICYYSGSLWVSIWAHMFNNGMEVVANYLKNTGRITADLGNPTLPSAGETLLYTAVFAVLAYGFYFLSRKKFDTFA